MQSPRAVLSEPALQTSFVDKTLGNMPSKILSRRDNNVLEKIRDPESNLLTALLIDETLPKDRNIREPALYEFISRKEREIVLAMQQMELEIAGLKPNKPADPVQEYQQCVTALSSLIEEQPEYASARNNRVQALRRLYGDGMLVPISSQASQALISKPDLDDIIQASSTALSDLDKSISLLSPSSLFAALSPQAAKTLSLAHTQRAAIYHTTSKLLHSGSLQVSTDRKESGWSTLEFEEAASRDFALGGRYGNEVAKGLAVTTNPTAKLCGQMVREMMKKEYGPGLA